MSLLDYMPPRPSADVLAFPTDRIVRPALAARVLVVSDGEVTEYATPEALAHAILTTPTVQARLARRTAEAVAHAISQERADRALAERAAQAQRGRAWARIVEIALAAGAVAGLIAWAVL